MWTLIRRHVCHACYVLPLYRCHRITTQQYGAWSWRKSVWPEECFEEVSANMWVPARTFHRAEVKLVKGLPALWPTTHAAVREIYAYDLGARYTERYRWVNIPWRPHMDTRYFDILLRTKVPGQRRGAQRNLKTERVNQNAGNFWSEGLPPGTQPRDEKQKGNKKNNARAHVSGVNKRQPQYAYCAPQSDARSLIYW